MNSPTDFFRFPSEFVVYIVDDDQSIRDSMQFLLKSKGLTCKTYSSAVAFLDVVNPQMFGCIILDVRMPGLTGTEMQDQLIQQRLDIPVIFISAHADVSIATTTLRKGAVDLLEKPVDASVLTQRIYTAFESELERQMTANRKTDLIVKVDTLTAKEKEVLPVLYDGLSLKELSTHFGFTLATASRHQSRIFEKLGIDSIPQLIRAIDQANFNIAAMVKTSTSE